MIELFRIAKGEIVVLRAPPRSRAAVTITQAPDLRVMVTEWQTLLRLLDWRITVSYVPDLCTSGGDPCYGLCRPLVDNKTAEILIRDPSTPIEGDPDPIGQIEETIIHELLHLWFAPFGTRSPAEIAAEENAVWAIAEALANAKGSGKEFSIARAMVNVRKATRARLPGKPKGKHRMTPEQKKKALEALESKDPEALAEAVRMLLLEPDEGPDSSADSDMGGENAAMGGDGSDDPNNPNKPAQGGQMPDDQRARSKRPALRGSARNEEDRYMARLRENTSVHTQETIRLMVHTAREVDKIALPPAVEKEILASGSLQEARARLGIARAMVAKPKDGTEGGGQHGSGAEPPDAKAGTRQGDKTSPKAKLGSVVATAKNQRRGG